MITAAVANLLALVSGFASGAPWWLMVVMWATVPVVATSVVVAGIELVHRNRLLLVRQV